jgi:hypothetical protein
MVVFMAGAYVFLMGTIDGRCDCCLHLDLVLRVWSLLASVVSILSSFCGSSFVVIDVHINRARLFNQVQLWQPSSHYCNSSCK